MAFQQGAVNMFLRGPISFFSTPIQILSHYLFDSTHYFYKKLIDYIHYAYERAPINGRIVTGINHAGIPGYHCHPLYGAAKKIVNEGPDGIANLFKELAKLAMDTEKNPRGMAYCSMAHYPSTLITRPHEIAQLVYNEDKVFRGIPAFREIFGAHNLFSLQQDSEWRIKRTKLMESILSERSIESLAAPMQKIVDEFIEILKNDGHVESLESFLVSLTMEVIARTRLGSGPLGHATHRISYGLGKAIDASSMPMRNVMIKLISISEYARKAYQPIIAKDRDHLQNIIKNNFFAPHAETIRKTDNLLREYFDKYPSDDKAAFSEAMEDASLYLLAGHETTERLLQFSLMLLYKHPSIMEKLRTEIVDNQPEGGHWTKKDLDKMTYLGKIIKETLRLYPPIPLIPRTVKSKFILADIPVCKNKEEYKKEMNKRDVTKDIIFHPGETINVMPYYTHRRKDLYENPLVFNPDRHPSDDMAIRMEMKDDQDDLFYFLPFGFGSRNCPGRRFAIQESKLFLIRILQSFNYKVIPDHLETCIRGTLKFKTPLSGHFEPLESKPQDQAMPSTTMDSDAQPMTIRLKLT
jgi:cytochrome P450